jgi:diguanylate cyclase (GGDEF)-like protein/PAS domain S-box-containing protein
MLRNAGHALRMTRVEDDEDFKSALQENEYELILAAEKLSFIDAATALRIGAEVGTDAPILVMLETVTRDAYIDALRAGAADVITKEDKEHLQLVVKRELESLYARRTLKTKAEVLTQTEKRTRSLLDSSRDAIVYVHDGMHVYANQSYLELFGYADFEDLEGIPIMDMVAESAHESFKEHLKQKQGKLLNEEPMEVQGIKMDGSPFTALAEFSAAYIEGEPCAQIIFRDRSNARELEEQLAQLSNNDLLTGLYNRKYMLDQLTVIVDSVPKDRIQTSLLYLVLDDFQSISERVGIAATDGVVRDIADLLSDALDEKMEIARFGDHSFAVLIKNMTQEAVEETAATVTKQIADHIVELGGQSVSATVSVGIVVLNQAYANVQEPLACAEIAVKRVMDEGGNGTYTYNPVIDAPGTSEQDRVWVEKVANALKANHFGLVYQPIVGLGGSSEQNYVVFVRMQDPVTGELTLPGQFLGAAASAGLMPAIDRWVVEHTLTALQDQVDNGKETGFFIKIATETILDASFMLWLAEQLRTQKVSGGRLTFELTEAQIVGHFKEAKQFANGINELHAKLAVTQYASSKSSANYLQHVPVSYVKFGRDFVQDLARDSEKQKLLHDITIEMHETEIKVIVEFVENSESLAVLWQSGVDFLQGYFLQEPSQSLSFDFDDEAL